MFNASLPQPGDSSPAARPLTTRGTDVPHSDEVAPDVHCPESTPEGVPCQKRLIPGLDCHGGGHWFMPDDLWNRMAEGHYNAQALLSFEPTTIYTAETCPGPPVCHNDAHFGGRRG